MGTATYIKHGRGMSWRAMIAYDSGEKPKSKWTKTVMIEEIRETCEKLEYDFDRLKPVLQKLRREDIFRTFFQESSWHHTGKYAHETSFYSIDEDTVECYASGEREISVEKLATKPDPVEKKKVRVKYIHWIDRRSRSEREEFGIQVGQWIWLQGGRKKRADGNWILNIEELKRAPRGKAWIFQRIEKGMPKTHRKGK